GAAPAKGRASPAAGRGAALPRKAGGGPEPLGTAVTRRLRSCANCVEARFLTATWPSIVASPPPVTSTFTDLPSIVKGAYAPGETSRDSPSCAASTADCSEV